MLTKKSKIFLKKDEKMENFNRYLKSIAFLIGRIHWLSLTVH